MVEVPFSKTVGDDRVTNERSDRLLERPLTCKGVCFPWGLDGDVCTALVGAMDEGVDGTFASGLWLIFRFRDQKDPLLVRLGDNLPGFTSFSLPLVLLSPPKPSRVEELKDRPRGRRSLLLAVVLEDCWAPMSVSSIWELLALRTTGEAVLPMGEVGASYQTVFSSNKDVDGKLRVKANPRGGFAAAGAGGVADLRIGDGECERGSLAVSGKGGRALSSRWPGAVRGNTTLFTFVGEEGRFLQRWEDGAVRGRAPGTFWLRITCKLQ